jgi:hypothetical protein
LAADRMITTSKQLATLLIACALGFGGWLVVLKWIFFVGGLR